MKIWACCTLPAAASVEKATGVRPITSPPLSSRTFNPPLINNYDLLYFRLHINQVMPNLWFGESMDGVKSVAIMVDQFLEARLNGAVVVVANCYGASNPGIERLYQAGASAVIAGPGPNYAAGNAIVGADLLVKFVIMGLKLKLNIKQALAVARARLLTTSFRFADKDALAFRIIKKEDML